jgi:GNAT superfamily N-acetyltransferase
MATRFATTDDIQELIELRFEFFAAEPEIRPSDAQAAGLRAQLREYYENHLNRDFYAVLADAGGKNAAVSFLVIQEKPANINFPTGRTGLILNVYTRPEHRLKGYATETLKALISKAKSENLSYLELSATKAGAPVYPKLGFTQREYGADTPMILRL